MEFFFFAKCFNRKIRPACFREKGAGQQIMRPRDLRVCRLVSRQEKWPPWLDEHSGDYSILSQQYWLSGKRRACEECKGKRTGSTISEVLLAPSGNGIGSCGLTWGSVSWSPFLCRRHHLTETHQEDHMVRGQLGTSQCPSLAMKG